VSRRNGATQLTGGARYAAKAPKGRLKAEVGRRYDTGHMVREIWSERD
jgi:hypothetical protein